MTEFIIAPVSSRSGVMIMGYCIMFYRVKSQLSGLLLWFSSCSQLLLPFFPPPFTSVLLQGWYVQVAFFLIIRLRTLSLVRREDVRRQRQDKCLCGGMHAGGVCRGGKQDCGTSLDKYTNYSFSAEKL